MLARTRAGCVIGIEAREVAGELRSRRLKTPPGLDVRPTPDRLREALFNVLAPVIEGAAFVDCHAGCGAVGIEALSRGAAHAVFIERSREAVAILRSNLRTLDLESRSRVIHGSVSTYINSVEGDIVFLDPPFTAGVLPEAMQRLEASSVLAPGACIYIEMAARAGLPVLPGPWSLHRTGRAGAVGYHLARRQGEESGT